MMQFMFGPTLERQRMNLTSAMPQRQLTRRSGFTMVEVLIAMGIAGLVFVTLYLGLAQCVSAVQSARYRLRATQILTEKLEAIRLYNWDQINTPGFIPKNFTEYYKPGKNSSLSPVGIRFSGTITVTNALVQPAYDNTMRKVVAQVSWVSRGSIHQERMETLVSQYGIQNYLY